MRRLLKLALGLAVLAALLLAVPKVMPDWPARLVGWATGGEVAVRGLELSTSGAVEADRVELHDSSGTWLTADDVALDLVLRRLLSRELRITDFTAAHVTMARQPVPSGGSASLPFRVILTRAHIGRLDIAGAVAGEPIAVSVEASADLRSAQAGSFEVTARPVAGGSLYHLGGRADAQSVALRLVANEPAGGLLARLAHLPDLGALAVNGTLEGPWTNAHMQLAAGAGALRVTCAGPIDLERQTGDLELTALVPAMSPVAAVSWQSATLHAHVTGTIAAPHGTGTLGIETLAASGATIERLKMDLAADPGHVTTDATLTGLRIPGPNKDLFASLPVIVHAEVGLAAPDHPVNVTASAGDLRLTGSGRVDIGDLSGDFALTATAPAMTPIPGLSWQSASLGAHLTGSVAQPNGTATLGIENLATQGATVAHLDAVVNGTPARLTTRATLAGLRVPGPRQEVLAADPVVVTAAVELDAPDRPVQLQLSHPLLDATGTLRTAGNVGGDMTVHLRDVAVLVPAARGALTVDGHLTGPPGDFSLDADATGELAPAGGTAAAIKASVQVHGISGTPTGALTATATRASDRVQLNATLDERGQAALRLAAEVAGAQANAAALYDLPAQLLSVTALTADWQGQHVVLAAPAKISFASGVTVERLRLGMRGATLDLSGRVAPTLALTAALHGVPASLADELMPGLGAEGTLNADARLTGTPDHPAGTLRLAASGIRLKNGPAASLPAANATATATLVGTSARIDANATVGSSRLSVSGIAPLAVSGPLALRTTGTVDLTLLNRVLAASGTIVRGRVTLDGTVDGTLADPRVQGTLQLANGEFQDVPQGVHLQAIAAALRATGDSVRLEHLTARAGDGTITASGTIGLAAPLPVDIGVTAHNARPFSTDELTTVLDADLAIRGAVLSEVTVGGAVTLNQTDIRVPEKLPAGIAVLNVVDRHAPPPPPPIVPAARIGLDVTVKAPARVFVRGRGMDAEFAGTMHVGGTTTAPRPDGRLKLLRGTFNLAGQTLTFSSGTIGLDGSGHLDPTLDFTATSTNADITATLDITGYASAPKYTLSSSPPLPQDEVLARLLFGRSTSGLGIFQLAQIASGVAQLTGVGGQALNPLDRIRSGLGVDYLSMSSQGSGTSLAAGRRITEGISIGAKQDVSGQGTQATVQFDLGHGLQLQTAVGTAGSSATGSSDSGGSSVGIGWQHEY